MSELDTGRQLRYEGNRFKQAVGCNPQATTFKYINLVEKEHDLRVL